MNMRSTIRPQRFTEAHVQALIDQRMQNEKEILARKNALNLAPPGSLNTRQSKNLEQHYIRDNPSDTCGKFIPRSNMGLIKALAQKAYDRKIIPVLQRENRTVDTFIQNYHPERKDDVLRSMKGNHISLISPIRLLDEDFVKQWLAFEYERKEIGPDAPQFITANGELVRSKTEILIADALRRHGIPYRYECPIIIDAHTTLYPDFTCLNARTRQAIVWEHFGLISDPAYSNQATFKLEKYILAGYNPASNLIITMETPLRPMSTRIIEEMIKAYFL